MAGEPGGRLDGRFIRTHHCLSEEIASAGTVAVLGLRSRRPAGSQRQGRGGGGGGQTAQTRTEALEKPFRIGQRSGISPIGDPAAEKRQNRTIRKT